MTYGDRVPFVGRRRELDLVRDLRASRTFGLVYLHGPGGIGKSALLRRMATESGDVLVDCSVLGPGTDGFEAAAAAAPRAGPVTLFIDAVDRRPDLEVWLRDTFLPRLNGSSLVVLAGRHPPGVPWLTDPGLSDALRVCRLPGLDHDEALALLAGSGYPAAGREALIALAGGHPLGLLAAPPPSGSDLDGRTAAVAAVRHQAIGTPPSPGHEQALEVCAHALATTEDLLRTTVGERSGELFEWLRGQPYVTARARGLVPDDVVRQLVEFDAKARHPERYLLTHRRMRSHLTERIRAADPAGALPAATELRFLYRAPRDCRELLVRRAATVREDAYRPADRAGLTAIARRAGGDEVLHALELWLDRGPGAVRVYRSADGTTIGALSWLELNAPDAAETGSDPLADLARTTGRVATPLRAGERIAIAHCLLDPAAADLPALNDVMCSRITAEMIRATGLAWIFAAGAGYREWAPPGSLRPVRRGGRIPVFAHDLRRHPVDGYFDEADDSLLRAGRMSPREPTADVRPGHTVLDRVEFDAAVRQALRAWNRPESLRRSVLAGCRLLVDRTGSADLVTDVRDLLKGGIQQLGREPANARFHRAAVVTYLQGAPSQAAAAARLGLPFGTYRRHLTGAIELLCERLWYAEIFGADRAYA
jgi:hypothetical protein